MILKGGWLKRKSPEFAALITGLCFSTLMKASLQRLEKQSPVLLASDRAFSFVGVAGFEPATLWSQTRCANRAALHPASPAVAMAKADS